MFEKKTRSINAVALVLACLMVRIAPAAEVKPLAVFKVENAEDARVFTPLSVALGDLAKEVRGGDCRLLEVIVGPSGDKRRVPVPCQVEEGDSPKLWWVQTSNSPSRGDRTAGGGTKTYELVKGKAASTSNVRTRQDSKVLDVFSGENRVLRYNHAPVPPPEGQDPLFTRGAFFHPLWSPSGQVLTRIHPADHIHHMGLWNPWTKTEFEGKEVDFWNLKKGQGTVRFAKFLSKTEGPVFGGFRALQHHVVFQGEGREKIAIEEEVDIRVWNLTGGRRPAVKIEGVKNAWLVDFTTTQRCGSSSPITLAAYRYGGLGFRATGEWNGENSDYFTSEGKTRKDGHGTRARWCAVNGESKGGPAGVLFMSHPENRAHPEPMRIWPQGDVFFNFCPIQKDDWVLEPGNDYVLKYRMLIYDGVVKEKGEGFWRDFSNPPKVTVELPRSGD